MGSLHGNPYTCNLFSGLQSDQVELKSSSAGGTSSGAGRLQSDQVELKL